MSMHVCVCVSSSVHGSLRGDGEIHSLGACVFSLLLAG